MKKLALYFIIALAWMTQSSFAEKKKSVFDDFIDPVSNPVYFESPTHSTELRAIYMYQDLHDNVNTVIDPNTAVGGNMQMGALQLRYAVNDRFSIIATKDGYAKVKTKNTLSDVDGFADLALGVKYSPIVDEDNAFILTTGFRVEVPTGDENILQGQHSGIANPFVSVGKGFGNFHILGYQGFQLPFNPDQSNLESHTSLHVDYKIGDFYPLAEVNIIHTLEAANSNSVTAETALGELPANFINNRIGFSDISNSGAGEDGSSAVSWAFGFRYKITESIVAGAVYENEVTSNQKGIFDDRITVDLTYKF